MFATGGIVGVIYEEFFGKRFSKRHLEGHPFFAFLLILIGISTVFIGTMVLKINSIYVSSAMFLLFGMVTLLIRHDLVKHAFFSGLFLGIVTLIFEIITVFIFPNLINNWWLLGNLSRVFVVGIPIEEIVFASTFGFVAGPMYEFVFGSKLLKN